MKKKNNQVTGRIEKLRVPNDKVAKKATGFSVDTFKAAVEAGSLLGAIERENPTVVTYFRLSLVEGYELTKPLTFHDRLVLAAGVTFRESGRNCASVNQLCNLLTGNTNNNTHVTPAQREAVIESLTKLMGLRIDIDFTETRKKMKGYKHLPAGVRGVLLPCRIVFDELINGQRADMVYFGDESPLMTVAKLKKQMLTVDTGLLAAPNIHNSPAALDLKGYTTFRVLEIVRHKLNPHITFADVFEKCGFADATKSAKRNAREVILKVMEHLKTQGAISSYEVVKRGGYHSVKISPGVI